MSTILGAPQFGPIGADVRYNLAPFHQQKAEAKMKTIKGPALFLAQLASDEAPFNSWSTITKWAADCGHKGVQIPSRDKRLFDWEKAVSSRIYCDEIVEGAP